MEQLVINISAALLMSQVNYNLKLFCIFVRNRVKRRSVYWTHSNDSAVDVAVIKVFHFFIYTFYGFGVKYKYCPAPQHIVVGVFNPPSCRAFIFVLLVSGVVGCFQVVVSVVDPIVASNKELGKWVLLK